MEMINIFDKYKGNRQNEADKSGKAKVTNTPSCAELSPFVLLFDNIGAFRLHQPSDTKRNRVFFFPKSMKLIDATLVELAKQYGNQDNARDPIVIARYMSTTSPAVWLVTDFDPETREATAFKSGMGKTEWDCFDLLDLARYRIPTVMTFYDEASGRNTTRQSFGRVVRDTVFTPRRLSECLRELPQTEGDKKSGFNLADLQELFGKKEEHKQEAKREHAHASDT